MTLGSRTRGNGILPSYPQCDRETSHGNIIACECLTPAHSIHLPRRSALPVLTCRALRSRTSLPYSLLDSFPDIYDLSSGKASVRTVLTTDTGISARIKSLRTMVQRGIKVDEREALSNSLGEIAEAYVEGWESGSDEDDD